MNGSWGAWRIALRPALDSRQPRRRRRALKRKGPDEPTPLGIAEELIAVEPYRPKRTNRCCRPCCRRKRRPSCRPAASAACGRRSPRTSSTRTRRPGRAPVRAGHRTRGLRAGVVALAARGHVDVVGLLGIRPHAVAALLDRDADIGALVVMDRAATAHRDARLAGLVAVHGPATANLDARRLLGHAVAADADVFRLHLLGHDLLLGRALAMDDGGLGLVVLDRGHGVAAANLNARLVLHGAAVDGHAGPFTAFDADAGAAGHVSAGPAFSGRRRGPGRLA